MSRGNCIGASVEPRHPCTMTDTRTLNHSRSNKENPSPALIQIVIVCPFFRLADWQVRCRNVMLGGTFSEDGPRTRGGLFLSTERLAAVSHRCD